MPMWLSSNMMDKWNYNLKMPHIDVEVAEPRVLSDLHLRHHRLLSSPFSELEIQISDD
jgi:hypothetical protein